jgi:hypothetical protein
VKSEFSIHQLSKAGAAALLRRYHYLSKIQKGFRSGINFGLFYNGVCAGVAIYTGLSAAETGKSAFGLEPTEQEGLFELARFVIRADVQATEHNLASWFLSRTIRELRRTATVRALLTYADDEYHKGTLYKATNFKYYGLSSPKKDFFFLGADGTYTKHSRGPLKGKAGEWRERSRKHRFLMVFDKTLTVQWKECSNGEYAHDTGEGVLEGVA